MGIRARKPARGAKRAAEAVEVEAGDFLVSLDEETNYLFKTKARSFLEISVMQRSAVTQHYADAQAATRARPIVVPLACRRIEGHDNNDDDNGNNGNNRRRRKR
jgi:NADH:ubiquinone oxidoreductase subunit D